MTITSAHVHVLNSLLFIGDGATEELPFVDGNGAVWSTKSCVAVSCLPDCDGSTEIIIGPLSEVREIAKTLVFDGRLETPSRSVVVRTVTGKKILERDGVGASTSLKIWTNGSLDTDKVIVGLT